MADFCTWGALAPPSGVDVEAAYAQVRALDDALAAAWKPLADGFADQMRAYAHSPVLTRPRPAYARTRPPAPQSPTADGRVCRFGIPARRRSR